MTYRQAEQKDLDSICLLIEKAITNMDRLCIYQWDEQYPAREDFVQDIRKGQSYVGISDERIIAVYTINGECDIQYQNGSWSDQSGEYRIIHRLCVHPDYQNRGIAKKTLTHIEEALRRDGVTSIRLDVYSKNPSAVALYETSGYEKTGFADWRKGHFYLMEKLLVDK